MWESSEHLSEGGVMVKSTVRLPWSPLSWLSDGGLITYLSALQFSEMENVDDDNRTHSGKMSGT